jgi:glycosyltransferase involved in cell wall biosynthesis
MTTSPLVSVVIPTYNCAQYVRQAVESVLSQTYERCEIIVVDDGSSDDTKDRLAPVRARIHYIYQANRGLPAARNVGIRRARGEVVAFLDADDWWLPTKLQVQLPHFTSSLETALVHCDVTHFDMQTCRFLELRRPRDEFAGRCYGRMFFSNRVTPSTVLVRREPLLAEGGFDETLVEGCEDYDLWLRLARLHPFAYVPERLVVYRLHGGNMSRNEIRMARATLTVLRKAMAADPSFARFVGPRAVRERLSELTYQLGELLLDAGDREESRRRLFEAVRLGPTVPRPLLLLLASYLPPRVLRRARDLKGRLSEGVRRLCRRAARQEPAEDASHGSFLEQFSGRW